MGKEENERKRDTYSSSWVERGENLERVVRWEVGIDEYVKNTLCEILKVLIKVLQK